MDIGQLDNKKLSSRDFFYRMGRERSLPRYHPHCLYSAYECKPLNCANGRLRCILLLFRCRASPIGATGELGLTVFCRHFAGLSPLHPALWQMAYYSCLGCIYSVFSGPSGIRTHDLLNAIEARSQLRYGPLRTAKAAVLTECASRPSPTYATPGFISVRNNTATGRSIAPVDLAGFEPATSSVRLTRAPNCATGPNVNVRGLYKMAQGLSRKVAVAPK